jgi:hypothetical protein
MTATDLSFGDFMKHLVAILHEKNISMPLKEERPWHDLFFELSQKEGQGNAPAFLSQLVFNWDGPYPRCEEVSEFLHSLHWNAGISVGNPSYSQMSLPKEIAKLWAERRNNVDEPVNTALQSALDIAESKFAA